MSELSEIEAILDKDLLIVDVESNGLWGQIFAVGAVRMTSGGRVLETYRGRCHLDEVPGDWFTENRMEERLAHFPLVGSQEDLMEDFLDWKNDVQPGTRMFVDCGFPVDYRFFDLIRLDKSWHKYSPYPLYDISSIIMAAGEDPIVERLEYAKELVGEKEGLAHDPVWDAEVSGLCAIRALRELQALYRERR